MSTPNPIGLSYIDLVASLFLVVFVLFSLQEGHSSLGSDAKKSLRVGSIMLSSNSVENYQKKLGSLAFTGALVFNGKQYRSTDKINSDVVSWSKIDGGLEFYLFDTQVTNIRVVVGLNEGIIRTSNHNIEVKLDGVGGSCSFNLVEDKWYTESCIL